MKKYHQHLAIVLVLCMILSMLPARIFASSKSTVSTNLAEQSFTVNAATEFTVTTHGNDDAGKTVWGSFTVQQNGQDINLQDVAKLEYQESSSGAWYEFYGDFGPASGFPMGEGDVTSHFKVTFRQAGSYDVRIAMVTANEAREVLCELQETITVAEAHNASTVSTNLAEQSFTVNAATEFTVTTHGNDDAGKTVWGSFTVQQNGQDINLQDVAKLEYQESSSGAWYEFYGDFGPASGFPMGEGDVTSHFKVTFRQAGSYDVRIAMVTANEAREVLCEVQKTITVAEAHNASTVSTNLAEQSFTVNTATEFTVTTHGNDDAGKTVWGSFTVQQNGQAINLQDVATLQYRNSADGNWYEFYGDFGPASGFPMGEGDVTSHFKVTFRQAGSYDVRIAMVTANEARKEVCAVNATIMVQKEKVTVSVTKEGNGKIEINGQEVTGASLPVNKNEEVTVTITPESGSYIKTLTVAGESKSVDHGDSYTETLTFDANATIAVKFVAEYTVTVDAYDSNAGSVTLNGKSENSITVDEGEEVSVCVTANEGYQISAIKIGGEEQTIQDSELESKTITYKVDNNCTVTVTFVRVFTVTVSYDDTSGSVSVAGATVANEGSVTVKETDGKTIQVTATPNSNYHVSAFTVNEIPQQVSPANGEGYTVDLPAEKDYKIEVTFALDTYTITFQQNEDGVFTDQDGNPLTEYTLLVEHGATVRFKFVPKDGYAATVSDGEEKLTAQDGIYQIENVTGAHTISAETNDVEAPSVTPSVSDADAWKQEKKITFTTADNSGGAVTVYASDREYSDPAALREAGLEAVTEYTVKANGTYYIYAVDPSDNFTKTSVKVEMIDTLAPEISQPQRVDTGRNYDQSITYTFTVTDTQSGVKLVSYGKDQDGEDAGELTLGEDGYQFTVTENGTYYVFAEDTAGNRNSLSVIVENVDTTPPDISDIAASEEWDNASNTVSFVATDNVGVKGAYWSETEYSEESEESEIIENANKIDGTDGKYEFSVQENGTYYVYALDEAGNIAKGNANVAYIDKVKPTGTISVDKNTWSELISVLTFGIWKNTKVEVTAVGEDEGGSGVKEVLYYKSDAEVALSRDELNDLYSDGKFGDKAITVEADERFTVYARIEDNVGNYDYISTDGIIYDNTDSVITIQPEKPNEYGYYNSDVKVGILVNENVNDGTAYSGIQEIRYTIESDGVVTKDHALLYSFEKDAQTGKIKITDWATGEENVTTLEGDVPQYEQLKNYWSGSITVDKEANNSDNVKVIVYVTDNAGNSVNNEENPCILKINSTPPTATLTSDDKAANTNEDGHGYFAAGRTLELTITDRATTFNEQNAIKGFSVTATDAKGEKIKDENGKVIEQPYALSEWRHNGAEHSVTVTFPYDGNYKWSYKYTNKADLSVATSELNTEACASPFGFTVDTTAPFGTVAVKSAEGREAQWDELAQGALHFGFWSREKITLRGTFNDLTSPIAKVEYYKVSATNASDGTVALKPRELDAVTNWQRFEGFDVLANEQFVVYIKVTDQAGNYCYLSTDGLIVDDDAPVAETIAPEITLQPQQPVNGIYNGNVKVDITVKDPLTGGTYSGLKKVSYKVFNMGELTQEETLFVFDSQNPQQGDLKQNIVRTITVDSELNNSNDVVVRVYAEDNAANSSEQKITLKIDTTAPTINVSYDNNNADSQTYFKANRTATIVVTERNFNPKDVNVKITGTGGSTPALSEWRETKGSGNLDNTRWIATVTYSVDGDYSFDIAYTDLANNPCPGAQYGNSVAPKTFTIDKTIPVIRVTYDNNEAQNTNYYKAARTATIMINEHNFSTDRIQITLSASDDGVAVKTPAVSGWTNNGDTHTATIAFADDAFYGFDIAYTDLAGNAAADFERQNFYVDQTAPALAITGVKDKSANKGDVIPKITYSDTNFDANAVEITLVGANRKDVSLEGEYQDIHNGAEFTFKNFEEKKEIDDIYTLRAKLTDKAGNTSEEVITFSVNRFGSTYALSEAAEKLNGTYVQTPIDVVITETNTDEIKNIKLTLFKNNETIVLNEGEDYAIELIGGDGQWYHYTYTIFAKNFENDGVYRLTLHSEDAAGNVAENTLDTKESAISFGVDSTNPTITVTNLESDETYALESIRVSMSANDNLMLASVAVYLDDYDKVYKSWSAEEVAEILSTGNSFEFDVDGNSTKAHKVKIVCTDAAGNETIEEITDFYVTTNLFVRFYTNTPLFIGSIVGVVALIGVIIFLIAKKKKTNKAVNAK